MDSICPQLTVTYKRGGTAVCLVDLSPLYSLVCASGLIHTAEMSLCSSVCGYPITWRLASVNWSIQVEMKLLQLHFFPEVTINYKAYCQCMCTHQYVHK